jgi:hypothetical protein
LTIINSFLSRSKYIKVSEEERKLAILCFQYLLFDCFDTNLSDSEITDYLSTGHYAFQDYAIMHWVDHLEALVPHLSENFVEGVDDISSAINDYFNAFGSADAGEEDIPQELKNQSADIEGAKYYKELLLLVSSARKLRSNAETFSGLGELGALINKNRTVLESMCSSGFLDPAIKTKLDEYYGGNWYKCPRHACYYFHEGFANAANRDNHVNRHEKPFVCTAPNCTRMYHGFSTEKDLKKHMARDHPDPAMLFPKIRKPARKHVCEICDKDFTRAHNLKSHMNSHANKRPYKCSHCEKSFVRKHDRERHVENLHPDALKTS